MSKPNQTLLVHQHMFHGATVKEALQKAIDHLKPFESDDDSAKKINTYDIHVQWSDYTNCYVAVYWDAFGEDVAELAKG